MNRNFRKVMALILAVLTLASCFSVMSFAGNVYAGHENHLVIEYDAVKPNGCTDGKKASVYCSACGKWIIPEEVDPAPHYPGKPTIKGTVTDCTTGYYIETKCTKCPVVVESKWVNEHDYQTELVEQSYCDVEGTAYKKCSVCGDEVTQPAEVREHIWGNWRTDVVGTCTLDGYEVRKCTRCLRTEEHVIKAPGHNYVIVDAGKTPSCKEEGFTAKKACSNCGDVIPGTSLGKKKHVDSDNDNYCDTCDRYITDELPEGCDCPCHEKSGIRKLLFQIAIFFLSIFKVGATCGCGAVHYEVRF